MDSTARESPNEAPRADVANLGLARPPWLYLAAILIGIVLDLVWSIAVVPRPLAVPLGSVLIIAAALLFASCVTLFGAADTPLPGNLPSTAIVRTGAYRISRNPIYLSFCLLHLGVAMLVNSLWLVMTLIGVLGVMSLVVIPREERYLERKFGGDYLTYKHSVRRWL